jgi:hypothetical protein
VVAAGEREDTPSNWELYRLGQENKAATADLALNTVSSVTFQMYQNNQAEKDKGLDARVKALEDAAAARRNTAAAQWFAIALAIIGSALGLVVGIISKGLGIG